MTDKHDKHDKLVEMARECGFSLVTNEGYQPTPAKLAAFRDRIVASLCADVEPVAFMFQHSETGRITFVDAWQKENGWALANPRYSEVGTMHGASTVASLTAQRDAALARVAELEKDAARYQYLRKYAYIELQCDSPRSDDWRPEYLDAAIDAALTKGQP